MRYITITHSNRDNLRQIIIKADMFNYREFVSIHTTEKLIIRKPYQMEDKKTNIFSNNSATIKSQIEVGKYLIDEEESNDEQIVIYYEDRIKQ